MAIGLLHDLWLVLVLRYQPASARRLRGAQLRPALLAPVWLLAVFMAWAVLGAVSAGTVRGFAFIGFGLGAVLYYGLFSRLVRSALGWLKWAASSLLRIVLDALAWAVLLPWRIVSWILRPILVVLTIILAVPGRWLLSLIEWLSRMAMAIVHGLGRFWRRLIERPPPPPPPDELPEDPTEDPREGTSDHPAEHAVDELREGCPDDPAGQAANEIPDQPLPEPPPPKARSRRRRR